MAVKFAESHSEAVSTRCSEDADDLLFQAHGGLTVETSKLEYDRPTTPKLKEEGTSA